MQKNIILCGFFFLIVNICSISSSETETEAEKHRRFLSSLHCEEDISNEYCATTLSARDLQELDERWKKEKSSLPKGKNPPASFPKKAAAS